MNILKLTLFAVVFCFVSVGVTNAQEKFTDLTPGDKAEVQGPSQNTTQEIIPVGTLRFYTDEGDFTNSCGQLALEDFEDTNVPPNSIHACPEPMNSQSDDACYSPGALIPGFSLSVRNPNDPNLEIAVVTPISFGITNVAVGPDLFASDTIITFTEQVNAAGIVLIAPINDYTVDVQAYGPGNTFLGSTLVNVSGVDGTFIGVEETQGQIERIELVGNTIFDAELMYELSFGECELARSIPTLSEWGLIAMTGVLGSIGLIAVRRKKAAA